MTAETAKLTARWGVNERHSLVLTRQLKVMMLSLSSHVIEKARISLGHVGHYHVSH